MKIRSFSQWALVGLSGCIIFFSCQEKQVLEDVEVQAIRQIKDSYEEYSYQLDWAKKHHSKWKEKLKAQGATQDLHYINDLSAMYFGFLGNDDLLINKLDSILVSPEFGELHYLNKFYTYYFAAYKYAESLQTDKALDLALQADHYLGNDRNRFHQETLYIKEFMMDNAALFSNLVSAKVKEFKNEYYEYKLEDSTKQFQKIRAAYNVGYYYNLGNEYDKAIEWIDKGLKLEPNPLKNKYYINLLGVKTNALNSLHKADRIREIFTSVLHQYQNGKISENKMREFEVYCLGIKLNRSDQEILYKIDELIQHYGDSCRNRFMLSKIYDAKAHIYKLNHDIINEKQALEKKLHFTQDCGRTDDYFITEEYETLNQLVDLNLANKNDQIKSEYFERIKEIDSIKQASKSVLWKINQYYAQNEMKYISGIQKFQEEGLSRDQLRQSFFIMILLILGLIGFVILMFLKRNIGIQKTIKKQNQKMDRKNMEINDLNTQLEFILNELESSNKKLKKFAKSAALDIESPLQKITQNITQISADFKKEITEEDGEILEYMSSSALQLKKMIKVLLEYSDNHQKINKSQEVNILEVLSKLHRVFDEKLQQLQGKMYYPLDFPTIKGNHTLIVQLFQNIISNAIKYKSPYRNLEIFITFRYVENEEMLQFSISDNGIGIPYQKRKTIFKVFKRLVDHESVEGMGLGLATCKRITEDMGGKIWVESNVGVGSTFYFTLPRMTQTMKAKAKQRKKVQPFSEPIRLS